MLRKFCAIWSIAIIGVFYLHYILSGDYGGALIVPPFALALLSPVILDGLYAVGLPRFRWLSCTYEITFYTLIAALTILCFTGAVSRAAMEWGADQSLAVFCILTALASVVSGAGICYFRIKEALAGK